MTRLRMWWHTFWHPSHSRYVLRQWDGRRYSATTGKRARPEVWRWCDCGYNRKTLPPLCVIDTAVWDI